jgi:hypothetical protein
MYKLTQNNEQIIRIEDQAFIPMVGGNRDWLDQGPTLKLAAAEL